MARICGGSGWCRTGCTAGEPGCSCVVGRCSSAGGRPELELGLEQRAGSCSSAEVKPGGCS